MVVPPVFYKYRGLAGDSCKQVENTFLQNQIYAADPASFNDPFDCTPAFAPVFSRKGVYALALRFLSLNHARWPKDKLEERALRFVSDTQLADMEKVAEELRERIAPLRDRLAIYCVSENCTNPLMWSHYADSHRGICIGFSSKVEPFAQAKRVKYSYIRHPIDPIRDGMETQLVKSLLLKSADWKYEAEWRYIDFEKGPGVRQLDETAIVEVVMGAHISPSDEYRVVRWIGSSGSHPKMFRARISDNHFKVEIHPYEESQTTSARILKGAWGR